MSETTTFEASNRLDDQDPETFVAAYKRAENHDEREGVRQKLKRINSGRWYNLLNQAHVNLSHSDIRGTNHVADLHSQQFLKWVGVYGLVEDLNTYEELTGVRYE